ncbi:hypothetical protein JCM10213v2_001017 [Rhodosporidiobolus nylandii]
MAGVQTGLITVLWKVPKIKDFLNAPLAAGAAAKLIEVGPHAGGSALRFFGTADHWAETQRTADAPGNVGIYVNALPRSEEKSADGEWSRAGSFQFRVEARFEKAGWGSGNEFSGWGFPRYTTVDVLKKDVQNTLTIRCTISVKPYIQGPPLPPPPPPPPLVPADLFEAYQRFFEDPAACDVRFLVKNDDRGGPPRELFANKQFLSARVSYFLFSSGFAEGAEPPSSGDEEPATKRRKIEDSASSSTTVSTQEPPSPWDDDDDSLEWLPDDWLEEHGPKNVEHEDEGSAAGAESSKLTVKVTDTGFITFRALLYFLYTNRVSFTPSASLFTVELIKGAASTSSIAKASSRRAFLLATSTKTTYPVEKASPHALYRVADKLGIEELKKRAREAIVADFRVENILYELISTFCHHFEDIQREALKYAWENWETVKTTPAFPRVIAGSSGIDGGPEILTKLLVGLPTSGKKA